MLDAGTGNATRWGRWDPGWINGGRGHSDNRGVNSVQIIGHLRSAAKLSSAADVAKYTAAAEELIGTYGYGRNAVNARIQFPFDENFCDDINTWPSYYVHLVLADAAETDPEMLCSLARSWDSGVRGRRGALYALIHAAVRERTANRSEWESCGGVGDNSVDQDQQDVLEELRSWPLDWIEWPTQNSHRDDVELRRWIQGKPPSRSKQPQSLRIL